MMPSARPVGELLKAWRQRRRVSQLALALDIEISPKHVSFVETGRATPSRDMILRFADHLQVPLRERNVLLNAAGYAPIFPERPLEDSALSAAREAVALVLQGHEPYPAIAVDRHWTLLASNRAVSPLLVGVDASLMTPPVNVLRVSLHPHGLAPRIANLQEWREHLLDRLHRQVETTGDPVLADLLRELREYPVPDETGTTPPRPDYGGVAIPFELRTHDGVLAFLTTTTVFGTPVDITLSELALESFFPADARTAEVLRSAAA